MLKNIFILIKSLTKVPSHHNHTFFTFECKISEAHSFTHFHHLNTRNFFQGPFCCDDNESNRDRKAVCKKFVNKSYFVAANDQNVCYNQTFIDCYKFHSIKKSNLHFIPHCDMFWPFEYNFIVTNFHNSYISWFKHTNVSPIVTRNKSKPS